MDFFEKRALAPSHHPPPNLAELKENKFHLRPPAVSRLLLIVFTLLLSLYLKHSKLHYQLTYTIEKIERAELKTE